jgi:hypothetical protein
VTCAAPPRGRDQPPPGGAERRPGSLAWKTPLRQTPLRGAGNCATSHTRPEAEIRPAVPQSSLTKRRRKPHDNEQQHKHTGHDPVPGFRVHVPEPNRPPPAPNARPPRTAAAPPAHPTSAGCSAPTPPHSPSTNDPRSRRAGRDTAGRPWRPGRAPR